MKRHQFDGLERPTSNGRTSEPPDSSGFDGSKCSPQLSLPNERASIEKRVFQAAALPKRDVEEGVTEIGPLGLVLAPERWVVGVGRDDDQHVGTRQARDEDPGKASRDDNHLVSHARPSEHVG